MQKLFDTFIDKTRGCERDVKKLAIAIHQEIAEAVDWINWKWWKKSETNYEELKVEMIDILHFFASMCNTVGVDLSKIPRENNSNENLLTVLFKMSHLTSALLIDKISPNQYINKFWRLLWSTFRILDMSDEDVFNLYIRKNLENFKRQFDKSFRNGTYYIGDDKLAIAKDILTSVCNEN